MKSIKTGLRYTLFLSLLAFFSCEAAPKDGYEVTFPMNEYLTTAASSPYPVIVQQKVDKLHSGTFLNVMNFGAKGNGLVPDDAAIAAAFAACKQGTGVLFPAGKTFLIKNLIQIPIRNDITVIAEGATFKMADMTGYNAIALESQGSGYNNNIIWIGGTWDGNKDRQAWPGSPTKNNNWTVTLGNYGLLTIKGAKFAMVKNVHLINTVYDGVDLNICELGVIADSDADGGAPLNYAALRNQFGQGRQSTYFKTTRTQSQAVYFLNLTCRNGSIGVQYSTEDKSEKSLSVVTNCKFYNQAQDAMHFEHCTKIFIYKNSIWADNSIDYRGDIHLSNASEIASIKETTFHNGKVDFRNGKSLKVGSVENCTFEYAEANVKKKTEAPSLTSFVFNATNVNNCTFKGYTSEEQVKAQNVSGSDFENFNVALKGLRKSSANKFKNGTTAIADTKGAPTEDGNNSFSNIKSRSAGKGGKGRMKREASMATSSASEADFKVPITITDQSNKTLGVL